MKRRLYFIWAIALLVILLVTGFFVANKIFIPKEVHFHAGFVVLEDNKKVEFSDLKYMSVQPCGGDHKEIPTKEEIQGEKAHLHDNIGDVLHSHREGALWKDLFTNLKYPIKYNNTTAYIDGKKVDNWQNQKIKPYDSLVVYIGENDPKHLQEAVVRSHIEEVEKRSENCGSGS